MSPEELTWNWEVEPTDKAWAGSVVPIPTLPPEDILNLSADTALPVGVVAIARYEPLFVAFQFSAA
jgi:hypothetical protein